MIVQNRIARKCFGWIIKLDFLGLNLASELRVQF